MIDPEFTEVLRSGVARFRERVFPRRRGLFERLAKAQSPKALFLTCADSRIVPSLITQTGPGELFVERNPGNLVPVYSEESVGVSASIEYAVAALRVEHIVICGHSDCGVIKSILHPEKVEQLPAVRRWMQFGAAARRQLMEQHGDSPESTQIPILTQLNVLTQIDNLHTHPSVRQAIAEDRLEIHGWVYHIENGEVWAYDHKTARFELWPGPLLDA